MDQEKFAEMTKLLIKSLIEKDKENFMKKEGIVEVPSRNEVNEKLQKKEVKMEIKKYKTGKEVSVNKKLNINWDNNYLQEIPFENVEAETEKALLINTTLSGYIWVNKKHCYKSKKYQFKPVFLIKVFNEMTYNIETNGDPDEPATIKGAHIKW